MDIVSGPGIALGVFVCAEAGTTRARSPLPRCHLAAEGRRAGNHVFSTPSFPSTPVASLQGTASSKTTHNISGLVWAAAAPAFSWPADRHLSEVHPPPWMGEPLLAGRKLLTDALSQEFGTARALTEGEALSAGTTAGYVVLCVVLVIFSGIMAGLTLGLLSLDQ